MNAPVGLEKKALQRLEIGEALQLKYKETRNFRFFPWSKKFKSKINIKLNTSLNWEKDLKRTFRII